VGDNEARDVVPARSEGLLAVLYDERGEMKLDGLNGLRVNNLGDLEGILYT